MSLLTPFVDQIKSLSLEEIIRERRKLADEKHGRTERIQEMAHQNYEVFTKTGEALAVIETELTDLEKHSDELTSGLATLAERCSQFSRKSTSLDGRRRLATLALAKHPEVMEILEIPKLMEKCVRQGSYEEALQLAADVKRKEMKIGHIPIIQSIHRDVEEQRLAMLSILISQLRAPIQLPQCVRIVGYLRRLGIYSEAELRLKFLQSRNAWLQGTLEAIHADTSYQLMLKTIEITRQNMFDIVTQYRALFSEDDPLLLIEGENKSFVNETAILPQWLSYRIRLFVRKLKETLPSIPSNSLDTILDQCMYFGMSFGRVSADFRGHLVPVFLATYFEKFSEILVRGKEAFKENLQNWSIEDAERRTSVSVLGQGPDMSSPSYSLLSFPPLAELCNTFIPAFNDLRMSPPLALFQNIMNTSAEILKSCAEELAIFSQRRVSNASQAVHEFFQQMCVEFRDHVVGFVINALNLLFPVQEMSRYTGLSMVELQNQRMTCLDKDKITASLIQFMPDDGIDEEINDPGLEVVDDHVPEEATPEVDGDHVPEEVTPEVDDDTEEVTPQVVDGPTVEDVEPVSVKDVVGNKEDVLEILKMDTSDVVSNEKDSKMEEETMS